MMREANYSTGWRGLFLSLAVCAGLASGCSLGPVNTPAFSQGSNVRRIDPNNKPFIMREIERSDPRTGQSKLVQQIGWKPAQIRYDSGTPQPFSINYDAWQFRLTGRVMVPIDLSDCRRSAILDTGFSGHVYVNDLMVESCDLPVFPLSVNTATGAAIGLCDIPSLRLGPTTIAHPPCLYEQMQWQFRALGIPLYRQKIVLLGLDLLRPFSYVLLDNPRHTIVFNPRDVFEPDRPSDWLRLPFTLEDVNDNVRMMVDLPIGREKVHVEFDTGGARPGLTLRETAWKQVASSVPTRPAGAGHSRSYQYGSARCRKYVIPRLDVGRIEVTNAQVDVLPDSHPLMKGFDGILSLDYFRNTVVVLDFRSHCIWIRQS
jgi:hypothetical protein